MEKTLNSAPHPPVSSRLTELFEFVGEFQILLSIRKKRFLPNRSARFAGVLPFGWTKLAACRQVHTDFGNEDNNSPTACLIRQEYHFAEWRGRAARGDFPPTR